MPARQHQDQVTDSLPFLFQAHKWSGLMLSVQVQCAVTTPNTASQAELNRSPEVHCLLKVHFHVQDQLLPCGIWSLQIHAFLPHDHCPHQRLHHMWGAIVNMSGRILTPRCYMASDMWSWWFQQITFQEHLGLFWCYVDISWAKSCSDICSI